MIPTHGEYGSPDEHLVRQLHQEGYLLDLQYLLRQFMKDVFESYGVSPDRAAVCADVLLVTDERGIHSHGLGRTQTDLLRSNGYAGILCIQNQKIRIVKETETTALLDGNILDWASTLARLPCKWRFKKPKRVACGLCGRPEFDPLPYGSAGYYIYIDGDSK